MADNSGDQADQADQVGAQPQATTPTKRRRGPGRPFKKNGENGEKDERINRTGRPKSHAEFTEAVRLELEPIALAKLRAQLNHKDPHIVQGAIKEVLNRARGRAPQPLTGEGGEGPVNFESTEAELLRVLLSTEAKLKDAAVKPPELNATTAAAATGPALAVSPPPAESAPVLLPTAEPAEEP